MSAYDSDPGLSDADISRIRTMLFKAKAHYVQKGYPPHAAYQKAAEAVWDKTGEDVRDLWGCKDREDYDEFLDDGGYGGRTEYGGRGGGGGGDAYGRAGGGDGTAGRGGRRSPWADTYEEYFEEAPDLRRTRTAREQRERSGESEARYAQSPRYADSPRNAETPRYAGSTRGAGRQRTKSTGTDYDRMFQNGNDLHASRTSGKILSEDAIRERAWQIMRDLCDKGANPEYARQQGEKFKVREMGKRAAAGYVNREAYEEEEEEEEREQPQERRGGERRSEWEDEGRAQRGQSSRSRSEYAGRGSERQERYGTSGAYSEQELRRIAEQIYEEWLDKGASDSEARREAKKWYNRQEAGASSRRSGFDGFGDMHESLPDDDEYPRRTRNNRSDTGGSSRSSRPADRGYRTEQRRPEGFSRSSRPTDRGYRTEERRPGGFANGNYTGYDDRSGWYDREDIPSGVKPDVDLYVLLGISRSATADEIKKAHRKLCVKHHPDRVQGGPAAKKKATDMMAQINQACDVLMDGELRKYYDATGLIASVGESPDA